jgi:hypothetical protein
MAYFSAYFEYKSLPLLVGERTPKVRSASSDIGAEKTAAIKTATKTEIYSNSDD